MLTGGARAQTVPAGALSGVTLDPTSSGLPDVTIQIVNQDTMQEGSTTPDEQGRLGFQFLSPGRYELRASKASVEPLRPMVINITVAETLQIELHMRFPAMSQSIHVSSDVLMAQTDNPSLGRVVGGQTLSVIFLWSQGTSLKSRRSHQG